MFTPHYLFPHRHIDNTAALHTPPLVRTSYTRARTLPYLCHSYYRYDCALYIWTFVRSDAAYLPSHADITFPTIHMHYSDFCVCHVALFFAVTYRTILAKTIAVIYVRL